MNRSRIELCNVPADFAADGIPTAVLLPPNAATGGPFPLCLVLHGGGASRQQLIEMQPLLDAWWQTGSLPPMVLATPTTGEFSYYLDQSDGPRWESWIAEDLVAYLRSSYPVHAEPASTVITGISMGGLGSLKVAFRRPYEFAAVAALEPTIEPGLSSEQVGARNRIHHASGGPEGLLGPNRDPDLFKANNPANLAREHAPAIRDSGLAIYLEVGDQDLLNLHDGTEFLHRVLWDLEISHEYHLVRGADHIGPSLAPRMREAFFWLGAALEAAAESASGSADTDPSITNLRAQLEPVREAAAQEDPNTYRHFGILPSRTSG